MVAALRAAEIIKHGDVESAMTRTDRADFCETDPYRDSPQRIGYAATISAPHMHAHALEILRDKLRPGARVLDCGHGSGFLAVAFAHMVTGSDAPAGGSGTFAGGEARDGSLEPADGAAGAAAAGKVVGVEHIAELVEQSIANTRKHHGHLLDSGIVELHVGDAFAGWPAAAPYDVIHVGAAAPRLPEALLEQLAPGGRMFIPVGPEHGDQELVQVDKGGDGKLAVRVLMGVRYVPLTTRAHQLGGEA